MMGPLKQVLKQAYSKAHHQWEVLRYPYLAVDEEPEKRPSIESIYYFINQLGRHKPEGLTHNPAIAYHELPFPELKFKVSRKDLAPRISRLKQAMSFRGKYGLDFGCAIGGVTFALQKEGARMAGIDRDEPSLKAAREVEAYFKTGAKFYCGGVSKELCEAILKDHHNPTTGRFDFAVWFSSFNWIAKAMGEDGIKEFLNYFSGVCDRLFMDSAIGGKGQPFMESIGITDNEKFRQFVQENSRYNKVSSLGADAQWYGREVFVFERV